jgi:putative ABC transport system permease protein
VKLQTDFAMLGAGAFQLQKWPHLQFGPHDHRKYDRRPDLTREQGEALRALPHVAHVSVEEWSQPPETLSTRERATRPVIDVCGGSPDWIEANAYAVAAGRFVTEVDVQLGRRVVFIGADVADLLYPKADPVGQEVRIRGVPFEVIGVAERQGSVLGLQSKDGFAVVPWTAYDVALGKRRNTNIAVVATLPEDMPVAMEEVISAFRRVRGLAPQEENDFEVFSNETSAELFDDLARMVGAATLGVCALALLVGGIGIMNIMLVSVTERTREIGVRMALGARRRRVLAQFLVEAVVLSLLGGLLGVLLGAGAAVVAREIYSVPARIPLWAVVVSLAAASGAGLLFGIYPAARASKLDPVEAMRTE